MFSEEEMDDYELDDSQKDLVRKGENTIFDFDEDELEDDDYYYDDDL